GSFVRCYVLEEASRLAVGDEEAKRKIRVVFQDLQMQSHLCRTSKSHSRCDGDPDGEADSGEADSREALSRDIDWKGVNPRGKDRPGGTLRRCADIDVNMPRADPVFEAHDHLADAYAANLQVEALFKGILGQG